VAKPLDVAYKFVSAKDVETDCRTRATSMTFAARAHPMTPVFRQGIAGHTHTAAGSKLPLLVVDSKPILRCATRRSPNRPVGEALDDDESTLACTLPRRPYTLQHASSPFS